MAFLVSFFANYLPVFLIIVLVLRYFDVLPSIVGRTKKNKTTERLEELDSTRINSLPEDKIVALYAGAFLSKAAQIRLSDPVNANFGGESGIYEALYDTEKDIESVVDLSPGYWGEVLVEEILEYSETGIWLDWKYSVFTMFDEDNWLSKAFEINGLEPITHAERTSILNQVSSGETGLMAHILQPLARSRGHTFLFIHKEADGCAIIVLPTALAKTWIGVEIGHVGFSDEAW